MALLCSQGGPLTTEEESKKRELSYSAGCYCK